MFENRIDFDFTWYYKHSYDQILDLPVPVSSGAYNLTINRGELSNKGFEFIINTVPVQTRNTILKAGLNFSRNRNYIVSLGGYSESYHLADIWGSTVRPWNFTKAMSTAPLPGSTTYMMPMETAS
ncbi:MAG: TonB-dependent receptor [Bacteroidales bacterium]|nr:TonB-dependent receptor [Bacteroidales bacterium]